MGDRSCVRRLRVEKKVHTLVLLRVWAARPRAAGLSTSGKITLTSPAGANLARFPARRVLFCGAYADDARFFGLVTSASNASTDSDSGSDTDTDKLLKSRHNSAGNGGDKTSSFSINYFLNILISSFSDCFFAIHYLVITAMLNIMTLFYMKFISKGINSDDPSVVYLFCFQNFLTTKYASLCVYFVFNSFPVEYHKLV